MSKDQTTAPPVTILEAELLRQSVQEMDQEYFIRRNLFLRQRFFLGLKQAFAKLPELTAIECNFSKVATPGSNSRNFLRDMYPFQDCVESLALSQALLPMRKAIGAQGASYDFLCAFFSNEKVVVDRQFLTQHYDRLLDPSLAKLDKKAYAQLAQESLEANTASPSQSNTRAPRL
jgi:hypothetical protein